MLLWFLNPICSQDSIKTSIKMHAWQATPGGNAKQLVLLTASAFAAHLVVKQRLQQRGGCTTGTELLPLVRTDWVKAEHAALA